ncbi:MAG: hypothetical protein H0V63_07115 [Burkholderiaceae bacterium]|nr:hypothetical protein [Burkholderiaceae bacterium]
MEDTTSPDSPEVVADTSSEATATDAVDNDADAAPEVIPPAEIVFVDHRFELPAGTPPELAARLQEIGKELHSGFTKKTQAVAEQRRQAEQAYAAQMQQAQEHIGEIAQLKSIDKTLAEYEKVDWHAWIGSDPQAAREAFKQLESLKFERESTNRALTEKQQTYQNKQREQAARIVAEGQTTLAEKIPGWGQEKQDAIRDFAVNEYGYTPQEVNNIYDPRVVIMLHDAMVSKKAVQVAKAPVSPPKPVPVPKVGQSASAGSKDPDKMSSEEWNKWRLADLVKKGKR